MVRGMKEKSPQENRKNQKKLEGWYQKKGYPHFDLPLEIEAAKKLVMDKETVAKHQFLPFISYEKKARRYKGHNQCSVKTRPIKYASHRDGYIYSYYSMILSEGYEKQLENYELSECVIGYRKGKGSNITFARAAFDEIERRRNCAAIAVDISGFFDNIDHKNLERQWCEILGVQRLPPDHLNVFKSLTRWSEVDRDRCYERLGVTEKTTTRPLCRGKSGVDWKLYRNIIKGRDGVYNSLISSNRSSNGTWKSYGIPQGSPASALLSNIYMFPFDIEMKKLADSICGYYRRYSDDILWICDENDIQHVINEIHRNLHDRGECLSIKEEKTEISRFKHMQNGLLSCDRRIQYLGFEFNGKKRLIRPQTLAKYWRRAIRSARSTKYQAIKDANNSGTLTIFRKTLNKNFTHLGKCNFITGYVYRAQKEIGGEESNIKRQIAGHYERISKELYLPKRRQRRKKK